MYNNRFLEDMCIATLECSNDNSHLSKSYETESSIKSQARVIQNYYDKKDRKIDIVKLNGSVELGPLVNLSDVILDIVETGSTLKENNLSVIEDVADISARLIANKSSFKFKRNKIENIVEAIKKEIGV